MRHLVAQHRGQFGGVAGERHQAARHIELAGRQREGVDRAGIEDGHPVGLLGTVGGRDQPVDGLADQGREFRIVIGAAIGGENALMFALARRRLRDGAARLRRRRRRRGGLEFSQISTGRKRERGAQQRRRRQEAAARVSFAPFCTMRQISHWTHDPWNRRSHPFFARDPNENRCPVFGSSTISRPAPQFAPPGAARSVVLPATRQRRGHESVDFRTT